jgi:hypothetical protein
LVTLQFCAIAAVGADSSKANAMPATILILLP